MTNKYKKIIASPVLFALLVLLGSATAHASEVTGTLTAGAAPSGSTVTGTLDGSTGTGSSGSISGTVTGGSTGGSTTGGSTGGSGGGGGGGGGVIGGSLAVGSTNGSGSSATSLPGLVLGTSTEANPGVPNTGEGGTAPLSWTLIALAALAAGFGTFGISRRIIR